MIIKMGFCAPLEGKMRKITETDGIGDGKSDFFSNKKYGLSHFGRYSAEAVKNKLSDKFEWS